MDHADVNHDGAIDCAEFADWATGVAAEIAASGTIPQHLLGFFKASFSNSDQNGDGEVDRDEFIALQKLWDVPEDKAGMGFDKLTNNGQLKLDEDSWMGYATNSSPATIPMIQANITSACIKNDFHFLPFFFALYSSSRLRVFFPTSNV